jgi:aminobenzoyl-glutamate utilization protein B
MDNRNDLWRHVDASKERFIELSDRVWAIPEVCYTEKRSVAEHVAELQHQGFRITQNVADIPTALIGEAGEGGPVIAFLGEYDALAGLSQKAGLTKHDRDCDQWQRPWLRPQPARISLPCWRPRR